MPEATTAVVPTDIRPLIYEIRGRQVMLDRDLAALYGVLTKNLNKAVKRNAERFPEDFMFQLSREECIRFQSGTLKTGTIANMDALRFQIGTSKTVRGGNRYASYAFTENGIAMLSSVLRSERAIAVNVRIMREFTTMRRAFASIVPMQSRLEAIERRQISDQSRNEERFDQIFAKMSEGELPLAQIFYQGKFWDAKSLLIKFIRRAKKELIVIDAYPGVATLDMLAKLGAEMIPGLFASIRKATSATTSV